MRAYVTSVGEKTTDLCVWALKREGWDVTVLDDVEPWPNKFSHFVDVAVKGGEPVVRVDADTIIKVPPKLVGAFLGMMPVVQFQVFDLYSFKPEPKPLAYSVEALEMMQVYITKGHMDPVRPEASIARYGELGGRRMDVDMVIGVHGFCQDEEAYKRAKLNKERRGQLEKFDFGFADKLRELWK